MSAPIVVSAMADAMILLFEIIYIKSFVVGGCACGDGAKAGEAESVGITDPPYIHRPSS
jgi:hypothetical protein